jgi:hypothetical protein
MNACRDGQAPGLYQQRGSAAAGDGSHGSALAVIMRAGLHAKFRNINVKFQ